MNPRTSRFFFLLFVLALTANLVAAAGHWPLVDWISKPLIIPALAGYFLTVTPKRYSGLRTAILLALLFSWVGDVLLMFQQRASIFFLAGLSSFLLANLCYIYFFHRVRVQEQLRPRPLLVLLVAAYYALLISILIPYLGEMKMPVLVYGLVISFMLLLALHAGSMKKASRAGWWMLGGAVLFVLSDSLLAINKFYQPFSFANIGIMLTYGLAQAAIVKGAARYLISTDNR